MQSPSERAAVDERIANEHPDLRARCTRCGYTAMEHDYDGACPSCEDDAAYYLEDNCP